MNPDHQPLAIPDGDEWQAGCICSWRHVTTYQLRAEAIAIAYAFHDAKVAA